ncbi:MAG: right-handed parallel beta-helix repeat-containing protein, partial [bacterium]
TGWDGIQVSSADSGCAIYDNYVAYDSDSAVYNQMSGILIGGGSQCDCFNNTVTDGKGVGINVFGLGNEKIYNNLIVRAGITFPDPWPMMSGIYTGNVVTTPGSGFLFANNTIISPKVYGIHFSNTVSTGNLAVNNLIIEPGVDFFDGQNLSVQNNYTNMDPVFDQFVDPVHGNYDLKPSSPAVNAAIPMSLLNLNFDIWDRSRPFAQVNDIGAYECHDSSLLAVDSHPDPNSIQLQIRQLQPSGLVMISYLLSERSTVQLCLYTITGEIISKAFFENLSPGDHQNKLDLSSYKSGVYICTITIGSEKYSKKFNLIR